MRDKQDNLTVFLIDFVGGDFRSGEMQCSLHDAAYAVVRCLSVCPSRSCIVSHTEIGSYIKEIIRGKLN